MPGPGTHHPMTPPRAPRRLSWAIAGRLVRGVAVAFMLVWIVGLVAWPERHTTPHSVTRHHLGQLLVDAYPLPPQLHRERSLSLLPDLLGM